MPWLNWSLKLHIRLRTITLLISTHNTKVYVQWMPYSFVWLYLIKCVFTCSIFLDSNIKRFLSVFGKYFVFTKTEKFQKQCCPTFWPLTSVAKIARFAKRSFFFYFFYFLTLFLKRVLISFSCILWMFIFWSHFQYFNTTGVNSKIFNYFVTIFSIFKERFGFCPLLFIFHSYCLFLMDFVLSMIFVYLLTVFGYLIVWCLHCVFSGGYILIYSILWQHWVINDTRTLIVIF